jgi:protein-disulfide isomerase
VRLRAGVRVGPYEVLAVLGAGGMGEVYRARDTRLGREVALKVISDGAALDPERLQRFEQEARLAGSLNHPNLVVVHDVGSEGGAPFLVTELLEGESLRHRLSRGRLPLRTALELGAQIAEGLAAAHARGVVHRDVKPENVFLTSGGRAKLLDFGIAKLTAPKAIEGTRNLLDTTLTPEGLGTRPGAVLGTPGYMSPEQVRGDPVDARTDIFSLGTVLYEMLAGAPAFPAKSLIESGHAILESEPPPLPESVPPSVDLLARRCLEKEPARRFQSAADLAFDLGAATVPTSVKARPIVPRTSRSLATRLTLLGAALALVLVLGLAAVGARTVWLRRDGAGSPAPALEVASAGGASHLPAPAAAAPIERWLVPIGNSPSRGPAEAPVTIVEFADFHCPYSKAAEATLRRLFDRYPQKLRLVWKDYPMSVHRYADGAAQVAREVALQRGSAAFWRAHDLLFAASPLLEPARLIKQARALGLEPGAVRAVLDGAPHRAAIDADVDLAAHLGSGGIPTFFVNGRKIIDGGPDLEQLVAEELAEARRRLDSGVPATRLYEEFERGAREHGEDWRRVALPDPKSRPSRGGPPRTALPVHEFCDLGNFGCALIQPLLHTMLDSYGDEVRLVWWDVSDPQQPEAARLARAAAGVGPRFWELHDLVLATQRRADFTRPPPEIPSPAVLRRYARQIGADLGLFDYVMATGNGLDVEQLKQARALGVRPPSLVIDGEVHSGFEPPRLLRAAIDRALARRSPPAR